MKILYLLGRGNQGEVYLCEDDDGTLRVIKVSQNQTHESNMLEEKVGGNRNVRHLLLPQSCFFNKNTNQHVYIFDHKFARPLNWYFYNVEIENRHISSDEESESFARKQLKMVISLLKAFVELHSLDILHRDIKPENIIVTPLGECYVIDFGLSSLRDDLESLCKNCGTPQYMPYERFYRQNDDLIIKYPESSDIWSAAMAILEFLIGSPLYQGEQNMRSLRLFLRNLKDPKFFDENILAPIRCMKYPAHFKDLFIKIIKMMLAFEPGERRSFEDCIVECSNFFVAIVIQRAWRKYVKRKRDVQCGKDNHRVCSIPPVEKVPICKLA